MYVKCRKCLFSVPNLSDGKKKSSRVSSFLLKKKNYFPYKDQSPDNTNSLDRAHNSQEGQLQTDKMTSAQLQNNKIENGNNSHIFVFIQNPNVVHLSFIYMDIWVS